MWSPDYEARRAVPSVVTPVSSMEMEWAQMPSHYPDTDKWATPRNKARITRQNKQSENKIMTHKMNQRCNERNNNKKSNKSLMKTHFNKRKIETLKFLFCVCVFLIFDTIWQLAISKFEHIIDSILDWIFLVCAFLWLVCTLDRCLTMPSGNGHCPMWALVSNMEIKWARDNRPHQMEHLRQHR